MEEIWHLPEKEGYEEPYKYPVSTIKQEAFSALLFFSMLGFLWENFVPVWEQGRIVFAVVSVTLLYLLAVVNTSIHERIHLVISRFHGYEPEVTYAWHRAGGFVNTLGQFVDIKDNIINLLGPLCVLGFVYSLFLLADIHWTVAVVFSILLAVNTGGSGADLIGAMFDSNCPDGTLVYYPEEGEDISFIYELTRSDDD